MPACVPPATRTFRPARIEASRNAAARGVRLPSSTRSWSRAARSTNLRMLTAEKPRLMPSRTTCSRCPSGSIASTNGWLMSMRRPLDFEHPLDQLLHLRRAQHQVGQLVATVAGDEDPARVVDPHLLDRGVVEERLQRPRTRRPAPRAPRPRGRCRRPGTTVPVRLEVVVVAHHALGDTTHQRGVALRVHALATDELAHVLVERLDELDVLLRLPDHHGDPRLRRGARPKLGRHGPQHEGSVTICGQLAVRSATGVTRVAPRPTGPGSG